MTTKTWTNFKGALFALVILFVSSPLFAKNVTNGSINFSTNENGKKYVELDGDWEFYANQTFTSLMGAQLKVDFIDAPASWTKKRIDRPTMPSIGCHTYRIVINGLRPNFEYAIFSRQSPSNSAVVYANGLFVTECGKFSRHKENYKAAQIPLYNRVISNENGVVELVIQVSNYTGGKSGILSPIYFGENVAVAKLFRNALLFAAAIMSGLLFIFLLNFSFWAFDKSKFANLCFAALIFCLTLTQTLRNFNVMGMLGLTPPFGIQFKLQSLVVFSGAVFSILISDDKSFGAKHRLLDKVLAAWTFALMVLFICLPEKISLVVLDMAMVWGGLYGIYILFRLVCGIKDAQWKTASYSIFYLIISFPIIIDHFSSELWTSRRLYLSEIAMLVMIFIDIIYIAAYLEILQKKAISLKNESSKYHLSARRFIPRNLEKIADKNIFSSLELGSKMEGNMVVMTIGFTIISPDSTQINLRDNFESMGFYSATIIDQINKRNGSAITVSSQGIVAVFRHNSPDALDAAHEIRDLVQTINARRAEDYYPCISFTIAIHQCDVLLGIVGDRSHIDFTVISSGIEVTEKMRNLGFAMNIPILISEPTVLTLEEKIQRKLKLLGKIHFSEFTRPIGLYGFISSEEEENRLEILDETPFITQVNADKYINF